MRLILTFLYFSLSIVILSTYLQAYDPVDRFTINCGSSGNSSDGGERTWMGDTDSKLLSPEQIYTTVTASANTQAPSINQIPYTTARLSRSQFNYSFPVTAGPKFLRLFFYPASYSGGFNRGDASFTIKSNGFTLLKDFNASLTADAEVLDTIFREYTINVNDGQRLDLSLTPTTTSSYAFINGIEILSMPSDLYYTPSTDPGFKLVGSSNLYSAVTSTALETSYRIKVGGQTISPNKDTGLFRNWEGNDQDFLKTPTAIDSVPADLKDANITVSPDYTAPKDLYRTARDMGLNKTLNKKVNLTWEFPVDAGFTYMLRLHFCELDPNINNTGDRVFFIYVTGKVAEDHADVMKWTLSQRGIAVHRNYAVFIPKNGSNNHTKVNLSLQMNGKVAEDHADVLEKVNQTRAGAAVHRNYPSYYAVHRNYAVVVPKIGNNHKKVNLSLQMNEVGFLNGLEIFKISDEASNNLAGPNPDPLQASSSLRVPSAGKKSG